MSSASGLHLEDVIQSIGGCGRFQITLSVIVHSMKCILCFTMIFMVFGAAVPDWWCMDDMIGQNASDVTWKHNVSSYKSCKSHNETETCSRFHYDDSMKTVITKVRLTHICLVDPSIHISWTSPLPVLGVSGVLFDFYYISNRYYSVSKVKTLIRRRVLWRLIWVCTVCLCPKNRAIGLYG